MKRRKMMTLPSAKGRWPKETQLGQLPRLSGELRHERLSRPPLTPFLEQYGSLGRKTNSPYQSRPRAHSAARHVNLSKPQRTSPTRRGTLKNGTARAPSLLTSSAHVLDSRSKALASASSFTKAWAKGTRKNQAKLAAGSTTKSRTRLFSTRGSPTDLADLKCSLSSRILSMGSSEFDVAGQAGTSVADDNLHSVQHAHV